MTSWKRVDPKGFRQMLLGFFLGIGVLLTLFVSAKLVVDAKGSHWSVHPAVGLAMLYGFMTVWLTFAARMYLTGVFVNDHGLRLRYVFSTRTLPWAAVTGFDIRPARILDMDTVRDACWVSTTSGTFETPVQLRSHTSGLRKDTGPVLSVEDFSQMLDQLFDHLERWHRRHGPV